MRSSVSVTNRRRILCVFPAYTPSFGTFSHAYKLMQGVHAFMPPQGLLLIAAYLPVGWQVRFIDENIQEATAADLAWADVVLASGMHIQAPQLRDIHARVKAAGKPMVLGGPSVSSAPEMYPEIEYLHMGEVGDATEELIRQLDESIAPPPRQVRFETKERLPLCDFPVPAYDLIPLERYLIGSLQFSSGCPYRCEFCDIPGLYGRQPRLKTPEQLTAELDAMRRQPGHPPVVYFVDDNFIGNRKAMRKEHNNAVPIMEAIKTLNSYGLEVTSGIILGLDSDSADTEARLKEFVDLSQIPILTMNLLQALPKTPLWDRLAKDDRIDHDPKLESNVRFLRPYDEVLEVWRRCVAHAYDPERLFARFIHQVDATYVNRMIGPVKGKLTRVNLKRAAVLAFNVIWHVGMRSNYRRPFWRAFLHALRRGQIDAALGMGFVAHHLIEFSREAIRGEQNASFYAARAKSGAASRNESTKLRKSAEPNAAVRLRPAGSMVPNSHLSARLGAASASRRWSRGLPAQPDARCGQQPRRR